MFGNTFFDFGMVLLGLMNVTGFAAVMVDKYKARKRKWRIPERNFFILSALGGGPGVYTGLLIFRHKTRHRSFMLGIPLIILIQVLVVYFILKSA